MNSNKMKTFAAAICAAAALLPSQKANAASVAIDSVRQRWPWNNKVDITYTIGGDDATVDKVCRVVITTVIAGTTYTVYDGAPNANVLPGTHTITWTGAPAGVKCEDCKMTAKFYTVAVPSGNDYMIVDLLTGAVSYEGRFANDDSFGGLSGQNLSNARYNVDRYKTTHMALRKIPKGTTRPASRIRPPHLRIGPQTRISISPCFPGPTTSIFEYSVLMLLGKIQKSAILLSTLGTFVAIPIPPSRPSPATRCIGPSWNG